MASNQQQRAAAMVSSKDKAVLEKMMKDLEANMKANGQVASQAHTFGTITNDTFAKQLFLTDQHDWSGSLVKPYYPSIDQGETCYFVHQGSVDDDQGGPGSKGGVIYADSQDPTTARYWLVAFHTPDDKVYVEAGLLEATPIDWNEVEQKLNNSTNTSSFVDPKFDGRATAQIQDGKLVADFTN